MVGLNTLSQSNLKSTGMWRTSGDGRESEYTLGYREDNRSKAYDLYKPQKGQVASQSMNTGSLIRHMKIPDLEDELK